MFRRKVAPGLEIRHFEMRDAEAVFGAVERNRDRLREWLPWVDQTRSLEDIRQFISRAAAQTEAGRGPQAIIWEGGDLAGSIGFHPIDWPNRSASIGYWLDAAHEGRGLITRCCACLLGYAFQELRLHRVEIRCGTGNIRSCAVPERLGFTREGVAREAEWVSGRWVDLVVWSMLAGEWK